MIPNVRHALVMRLIDDAMKAQGYSRTPGPDGWVVYWPQAPAIQTVRLRVTPEQAWEDSPEIVAQQAIVAAFAMREAA